MAKDTKYFLMLMFFSLLGLIFFIEIVPEHLEKYSLFFGSLFKVSFYVYIFWLFDKKILKSIDTISELKKGNIAYALFLVAIALVFIGASIRP